MIERDRFIALMARFMAELPTSVTRGQPPNTRHHAIKYLKANAEKLLRDAANPATFASVLDAKTDELATRLGSWGVARKCLNIFLRDATFNVYLRNEFKLCALEPLLEVPLDTRVATKVRQKSLDLPRWISIRALAGC